MTMHRRMVIAVESHRDQVEVGIGDWTFSLSYPLAFTLAQRLTLASNGAGREAGASLEERRHLRKTEESDGKADLELAFNRGPADGRFRVRNVGQLVELSCDGTAATFDAEAAAQLGTWIRMRARDAKHWAGDTSKTLRLAGNLTLRHAAAD